MYTFKRLIICLICIAPATGWSAGLMYDLDVHMMPSLQRITGIARLQSDTDEDIPFYVKNLQNIKINGKRIPASNDGIITIALQKGKDVLMEYDAVFQNDDAIHMDEAHVFLSGTWYPRPDLLAVYRLAVTLPENFIAVSEAESISRKSKGASVQYGFHFRHPRDSLNLAASSRYAVTKDTFRGIRIEAYFFQDDAHLADGYLAHAKKYLQRYEELLTPYPYKRFAVVENVLPTGTSMPTFTLLGEDVVNLPFIVKTSLGHEILHQWFGNSVYIDASQGNWSEGITTYLSDHYAAKIEKLDAACRKQFLIDYAAYVNPETSIPLRKFHFRSDKATAAIGYGKAAMLFHDLKNRLGEATFLSALKHFLDQYRFQRASWYDLQRSFENLSEKDLTSIFESWLNRDDIPELLVKDADIAVEEGQLRLKFTLQQPKDPFPLATPVTIYGENGIQSRVIDVVNPEDAIVFPLNEMPFKAVLDENYNVMRHLSEKEIPPVLAAIFGSKEITIAVSGEQRDVYQPLVDALGIHNVSFLNPENLSADSVRDRNILIAGYDSAISRALFGHLSIPQEGIRLKVFKNPFNTSRRLLLAHVANKDEAQAVRRKLRHYGKYSELAFNQGKIIHKSIADAENGLLIMERAATHAVKPGDMKSLQQIIPNLKENRVVFVGEQHDRFAHHINQLQIIRKLYQRGIRLAVGMEMFKQPFQHVIDAYLADRIDERTFLENTRYYHEWGYDYHLYKPIIDFLKKENIPLIALNLESHITQQVARKGMEGLDEAAKKKFPEFLDFTDPRYMDDLKEVFDLHNEQEAIDDFNRFLQAQVLWDESMAERAAKFIRSNPDRILIILAGNGHLRYRYGIPRRLFRRIPVPFTVILQDERTDKGIADYVLSTTRLKGILSPKLGVSIEDTDLEVTIKSVANNSPAKKAGLEKCDVILSFNHQPIESLADLRLALYGTKHGGTYPVSVKRADDILEENIQLFDFSGSPPHAPK